MTTLFLQPNYFSQKKRGDLPLDMPGGCIPTSGSPIDMTLPRDIMLLMQKLCRRKRLSKYRKT
jgi:hypothetical protein